MVCNQVPINRISYWDFYKVSTDHIIVVKNAIIIGIIIGMDILINVVRWTVLCDSYFINILNILKDVFRIEGKEVITYQTNQWIRNIDLFLIQNRTL